jgi:hypothetical protein
MASIRPSLRSTETYTETNFLRLQTSVLGSQAETLVTLEHFAYSPGDDGPGGWSCLTIVDAERMTRKDAVFIARSYAREHEVPVIYDCQSD